MDTKNLGKTIVVAAELALFLLVIERRFQVESAAFTQIVRLAIAGYLVHALLPKRFRAAFFLLLSLAAIVLVFGAKDGAALIAFGLVLIGLCHLPIPIAARAALVLAAGAVLAFFRASPERLPVSPAIWPILGAMFMFRLIVYLYDIRHEKAQVPVARRLSYFFLLPNVCFPLFPVVDYAKFTRGASDENRHDLHQRGV
ncbi:MAG: hypothetical protein EHM19_12840, partial [Candidatus Latescibacterota bacterium]